MNIRKIAVIGAGQMGGGIAQVAASAGFDVLLSDRDYATAEKGKKKIESQLQKLIEKGKMTSDESAKIVSKITAAKELNDLAASDVVIEAAPENIEIKKTLFRSLDDICKPETLFATNTSSISITDIAAVTRRPDRVAGMHFMNPVPVMKLVEGIRAIQTSDQTFSIIRQMAEKMGKTFVEVRDMPGFAVNRILMPMINEAVFVLYEGIASVEDVDTAMKLGTNQPMGPLTLADFIGLDTCLAIMNVLHDGLGDAKYRPCPLLKQYVAAGWLGKKSGRGFYRYDV